MEGGVLPARLGDTDCEAIGASWLAQPANSLSSLGFFVVGAALALWAVRQPPGRRLLPAVYAAAVAVNAVGGLGYHGPAWAGAGWMHDVALLAPLVFIVLYDVSTVRPMTTVQLLGAYGVIIAGFGMMVGAAPRFAVVANAIVAALVLGMELVAAPHRYRFRRARQAYAVAIGALLVGVVANVLGRTDGALCSPDSPVQAHALWHVGAAVALGAWGVAAFVSGSPASRRRVSPAMRHPTPANDVA